jgi:hypothetical protein
VLLLPHGAAGGPPACHSEAPHRPRLRVVLRQQTRTPPTARRQRELVAVGERQGDGRGRGHAGGGQGRAGALADFAESGVGLHLSALLIFFLQKNSFGSATHNFTIEL